MAVFLDDNGGEWKLELNIGLIEDVKSEAGVDLDILLNKPEDFAALVMTQPRKLVEVLWVMCEDQAIERQIDPKNFGRRFNRNVIDRASDAFIEAVVSFYPRSSAGRTIRKYLPQLLKQMDDQLEEKMEKRLKDLSLNSRTNTRE